MQKLGENSPMPGGAHISSPLPPPIIEPSALRPRSSNPPAEPGAPPADKTDIEAVYEAKLATPTVPHLAPPPALELVQEEESKADKTEPKPPPKVEPAPKPEPKAEAKPESKPAPKAVVKSEKPPVPKRESTPVSIPQVPKPKSPSLLRLFALAGVLALATFVAVRISVAPAPVEPAPTASSVAEPPINVLYTDLPPGATLAENEGWLAIHAPEGTVVLVDGIELTAPESAIAAGNHELRAGNRTKTVDVRAGKTARVDWP
jgi:hypothetical protein